MPAIGDGRVNGSILGSRGELRLERERILIVGARICLLRKVSGLADLLDDPVPAVARLDLLDIGPDVLVARGDEETISAAPHGLIFGCTHLNPLRAGVVPALTDPLIARQRKTEPRRKIL